MIHRRFPAGRAHPQGQDDRDPLSGERVSRALLFGVWLKLGIQSFGGGTATLALIRRAVVEDRAWISEDEFSRCWTLVQVAPGINLIGLTILLGRRLAGATGIALTLIGLLLPSAAITVLLTAGYAHIQGLQAVRAAFHGIVPAIVGLGLLTGAQTARPYLAAAHSEGIGSLVFSAALMAASAMAVAWVHAPVLLVLLGAGGIGGLYSWRRAASTRRAQEIRP